MPTSTTMFPFDPTGSKASNLISREQQVLSPPIAHSDYHLLIPKLAPFFSDGLIVKHQDSGRVLQEGIDYELTHHHRRASWAIMKPVYGSVLFSDRTLQGVIEFTYQTLGGEWTVDGAKITQVLSTKLVQPRTTTWEQIVTDSIPCEFPPIDHQWNLHDMVGMSEVKEAIDNLTAMLKTHLEPYSAMVAHVSDRSNPHEVNKDQIDLGLVENFPPATKAQAEVGTNSSTVLTPLTTKYAFDKHIVPYDKKIDTVNNDLRNALSNLDKDMNDRVDNLTSDVEQDIKNIEALVRYLTDTEKNDRESADAQLENDIKNLAGKQNKDLADLSAEINAIKSQMVGDFYTKAEINTIFNTLDQGSL